MSTVPALLSSLTRKARKPSERSRNVFIIRNRSLVMRKCSTLRVRILILPQIRLRRSHGLPIEV